MFTSLKCTPRYLVHSLAHKEIVFIDPPINRKDCANQAYGIGLIYLKFSETFGITKGLDPSPTPPPPLFSDLRK